MIPTPTVVALSDEDVTLIHAALENIPLTDAASDATRERCAALVAQFRDLDAACSQRRQADR